MAYALTVELSNIKRGIFKLLRDTSKGVLDLLAAGPEDLDSGRGPLLPTTAPDCETHGYLHNRHASSYIQRYRP